MNARHPQIAAEQATSLTATAAAGESGYPARWTSTVSYTHLTLPTSDLV